MPHTERVKTLLQKARVMGIIQWHKENPEQDAESVIDRAFQEIQKEQKRRTD